jgi:hypothetical protein
VTIPTELCSSSNNNNNNNNNNDFNVVTPDGSNVNTKETEKLSKYKDLEIEVSRMWKVRTKVVPVTA